MTADESAAAALKSVTADPEISVEMVPLADDVGYVVRLVSGESIRAEQVLGEPTAEALTPVLSRLYDHL